MKTHHVLVLSALFVGGPVAAQTTNSTPAPTPPADDNPPYVPPPVTPKPHVADVPQPDQPAPSASSSSADNVSPEKLAEYRARFQQGYELEQAGKVKEARDIYDSILSEQPRAKGSLLRAGVISFELDEMQKANDYLDRLCAIIPDEQLELLHEQKPDEFPDVLEMLIEANQALKHDVKVEFLIKRLTDLYDSGTIPELSKLSKKRYFDRELIHLSGQALVISQFYHYTDDPNTIWMGQLYDKSGNLQKRILLNYDPDATKALQAKGPQFANAQVCVWYGHEKIVDGTPQQVDAYLQIFAIPDYDKFKSALLLILSNPPKPIYSTPVDTSQQ